MSNLSALFSLNLGYTGPSSESTSIPPLGVYAPYQPQNSGAVDVPDATPAATTVPVPFGGIGVNATGVLIINATGQELEVKINGAATPSHSLVSGGVFLNINPSTVTPGTPLLSVDLITTAIQSGDGKVVYYIFGNPT